MAFCSTVAICIELAKPGAPGTSSSGGEETAQGPHQWNSQMIPPSFFHVLEPLGRPTKQTGSAPNWRRMERPLRTPRDRYLRSEPEAAGPCLCAVNV